MDKSTATAPPRRRTPFRYSVRSILAITTLIACCLGAVMYERHRCEMQQSLIDEFDLEVGRFRLSFGWQYDESISVRDGIWQKLLGDNRGDQVTQISFSYYVPELTYREMSALVCFPNLKSLTLRQSKVDHRGYAVLARLPRLEQLDLRQAKMSDQDAVQLSNLKNLKILHLQQTQIGDAGVQHLSNLKNLEHLDLSDTRVSEKAIDVLAQFTKLKLLALNPATFSFDARDKLRKRLPKCDIIFAKN